MDSSLHNFKKRKSFLTLIKKNSHKSYPSELLSNQSDGLTPESEWKSVTLENKVNKSK